MKRVPEREAAKAAGERFYFTGKPCRNGHVVKRYTGTGLCSACATRNTLLCQSKGREHPERTEARKRGDTTYGGHPCKWGHDIRRVSNGICVQCEPERQRRYHKNHPGVGTKLKRQTRAKNPQRHRDNVKRWAKENPEKVRKVAKRAAHAYRARKRNAPGTFTQNDIDALFQKQDGLCAGCNEPKKLELDHIQALARGGSNDPGNLQLLCRNCNAQKSSRDVHEWISSRKT